MTNTIKISPEMARTELIELLDCMDIDTDVDSMLEEDQKGFEDLIKPLVGAMVKGKAHIDGESFIFTLKKPIGKEENAIKEVKISEPDGVAWELIDRTKKGEDIKKLLRFAEGFTGIHYAQIRTMPNSDLKILRAFSTLFLA